MKNGDLVVYRYSKAAQLKRKIYVVVDANYQAQRGSMVRLMDAFGKQKNGHTWHYIPLEEYDAELTSHILMAEREAEKATKKANERSSALAKFRWDKAKASSWFPKI